MLTFTLRHIAAHRGGREVFTDSCMKFCASTHLSGTFTTRSRVLLKPPGVRDKTTGHRPVASGTFIALSTCDISDWLVYGPEQSFLSSSNCKPPKHAANADGSENESNRKHKSNGIRGGGRLRPFAKYPVG